MEEKFMIENLLNASKTLIGLYQHASVESTTPKVHKEFVALLDEALQLQNEIYTAMSDKGWYKSETAQAQQITKVINTYASK